MKMSQNLKFFYTKIASETVGILHPRLQNSKITTSTLGGAALKLPGHGGVVFVAESGARRVCPAGRVPPPTRAPDTNQTKTLSRDLCKI
jgi:hypothetical protein